MATYPIPFNKDGELEVADDVCPWYICNAPYGITMLGTSLAVKTPCETAPIIVDIEWSEDGENWESIFGSPFLAGTHDGPNSSGSLIDSGASFTDALEGLIVNNTDAGTAGTVTVVISSTTLTTSITWDTGDIYTIAVAGGILPGEYIGIGGTPTVTSLAEGNLLRLDVEQCGTPTAGSDLTVNLRVRQ